MHNQDPGGYSKEGRRMIIQWEKIQWEADDSGASSATLADEDHNNLTLQNRDGKITFHTDGSPSFDISTVLDITTLCMILCSNAIADAARPRQGRATARGARAREARRLIPEPRRPPTNQPEDVKPKPKRISSR
jgi:hypothetical protein